VNEFLRVKPSAWGHWCKGGDLQTYCHVSLVFAYPSKILDLQFSNSKLKFNCILIDYNDMWMTWQRMCQLTFFMYTNQILGNLDIMGSPTYKLDEAWFFLVSFWYMMVDYEEWFVFPSHLQCKCSSLTKNKTPIEKLYVAQGVSYLPC
jgi:hypothetical protein